MKDFLIELTSFCSSLACFLSGENSTSKVGFRALMPDCSKSGFFDMSKKKKAHFLEQFLQKLPGWDKLRE